MYIYTCIYLLHICMHYGFWLPLNFWDSPRSLPRQTYLGHAQAPRPPVCKTTQRVQIPYYLRIYPSPKLTWKLIEGPKKRSNLRRGLPPLPIGGAYVRKAMIDMVFKPELLSTTVSGPIWETTARSERNSRPQ